MILAIVFLIQGGIVGCTFNSKPKGDAFGARGVGAALLAWIGNLCGGRGRLRSPLKALE